MPNEYILQYSFDFTITSGAYTRVRKKLKHSSFIELDQDSVDIYYRDNEIKKLFGFRELVFDGTDIILPTTDEMKNEFGF